MAIQINQTPHSPFGSFQPTAKQQHKINILNGFTALLDFGSISIPTGLATNSF